MQAVYLKDGDRRLKVSVAKCGFDFLGCRVVNIYIYLFMYLCYLFMCIYFFGRYLSECFSDLLGSERPWKVL